MDALQISQIVIAIAVATSILLQARGTGPDRLIRTADSSTRIIAASYVSYLTGERTDLRALRVRADELGALLVVDFTQAAGWLPVHVWEHTPPAEAAVMLRQLWLTRTSRAALPGSE